MDDALPPEPTAAERGWSRLAHEVSLIDAQKADREVVRAAHGVLARSLTVTWIVMAFALGAVLAVVGMLWMEAQPVRGRRG